MLHKALLTENPNPSFWKYLLGVHLYALGTAMLPLITQSYGNAGPYCWIDNSPTGHVLRLVCHYLPVWIFLVIISILFWRIIRSLKLLITDAVPIEQTDQVSALVHRLVAYPLIMFLCFVAPTANRIQNVIDPEHSSFALYLGVVISLNLNGLANSVVFGLTDETTATLRQACCNNGGLLQLDEDEDKDELNIDSPRSNPTANPLGALSPAAGAKPRGEVKGYTDVTMSDLPLEESEEDCGSGDFLETQRLKNENV
eukprot:TRINITY_DN14362_c0_g1_i1.p1 TRINITY_DN14362_c0_g1~~TRINITY_DN14362_c0_g1_i1.p1  ORF type:complete len:256 (+),score=43.89 TRINITY_DN14362_c0_g1_i1:235-1002(+)